MADEITLREYIEKQLELRDRALAIAAQNVDKRLDGMNELRRQIEVERGDYVTRVLYDERHESLEQRINKLESDADRAYGSEGAMERRRASVQPWMLLVATGIVSFTVVIVNLLLAR